MKRIQIPSIDLQRMATEETVQNYEQLVKVWYKKVDKSEKRPFDNKKALK